MKTFLDINNIFFNFAGYPMSYVEFFGTIFNIWSVWLVARNKTLNWPIGIIGVILFGALYLQINLYSDFLEQIYFFITGFWGWWTWTEGKKSLGQHLFVTTLKNSSRLVWIIITIISTFLLSYITTHLHVYFPDQFPASASYALLDAFTTILSFVATIFMVRKKIECWYLWILVDLIGIWLYWVKGVHFVSFLYVLFLIMATQGLFIWLKIKRSTNQKMI